MKKTVLFVLVLCLCFAAFSPAFAETAVTEAPAAEELYQAGRDAVDAGDYATLLVDSYGNIIPNILQKTQLFFEAFSKVGDNENLRII